MSFTSFRQYLLEEQREAFFTFGRMNPPTIGHGKLMNVMSTKAGSTPYKIFLSKSQDPKKNPLTYEQKIKHVRKMFPKHARNVILNKKINTVFTAADLLYNQGFNKITMVVGEDRVLEFKTLLEKYNGVERKDGFYNFERINVVSAGERDPDAEGIEGVSASKQRDNASKNDFVAFSQGVPTTMSDKDAKRLFNDVRSGMGLTENYKFKNHIELGVKSSVREQYIEGNLFNEGDRVVIKTTNQTGYIYRLGANHVIVSLDEGKISRQWLDNIALCEKTSWKSTGHYKKNGEEWLGDQHAHNGQVMTGKTHTASSENLYHFKDLPSDIQRKILAKLDIKDVTVKESNKSRAKILERANNVRIRNLNIINK